MCAFARNKDKCTAPVDAPMEKRGHLQMPRPEIATAATGRAPLKLSVCVICELPCSIRHVVFRASVCLGFFSSFEIFLFRQGCCALHAHFLLVSLCALYSHCHEGKTCPDFSLFCCCLRRCVQVGIQWVPIVEHQIHFVLGASLDMNASFGIIS